MQHPTKVIPQMYKVQMKLLLKLNVQRYQNLQAVKTSGKAGGLKIWTAQSGLIYVPPKGDGTIELIYSLVLFFLMLDVISYRFLVPAHC